MHTVLFIGTWEIVAIVLVILLLFGGKKIPELARGLGKGVKNFKQGLKEVEDDISSDSVTPAEKEDKKEN